MELHLEASKGKVFVAYFLATALVVYVSLSFLLDQQQQKNEALEWQRTRFHESCSTNTRLDSNLTFSRLSSFLMDNYDIAIGDETTPYKEKLYNALMGMDFAERDGKPVPINGHPYLFVGSVGEYQPSVIVLA
jgi:hypothetical protein